MYGYCKLRIPSSAYITGICNTLFSVTHMTFEREDIYIYNIKIPVIRGIMGPERSPGVKGICIVLEKYPPVLDTINSILHARPVSHRLKHIV